MVDRPGHSPRPAPARENETGTESLASGPTLPAATTLLGSTEPLAAYDGIILSCHGDSGYGRAQPTSEKQAMKASLDSGARAFGSHFDEPPVPPPVVDPR